MQLNQLDSEFLKYIIQHQTQAGERLPKLQDISKELGISVGKLREQLEVARVLGYVSVRPGVGVQREPFDFAPSVLTGMLFGLGLGEASFEDVSQLRKAVESSLWLDAVVLLTDEDKQELRQIVNQAWRKLRGQPIHVPNGEHRQLHLTIFRRLENPFVQGLLNAYWDAYAASELTRYSRYQYWLDVWEYHERIVVALEANEFEKGRALLIEHFSLLSTASDSLDA